MIFILHRVGYPTWPNCGGSNLPSQPPPSTVCAAAGTSFKDNPDVNGSINQTFAYVAHINNLIINDPELNSITNGGDSPDYLFYLVTSASYDNEGNSGKYPGNFSCNGNNKAPSSANIATTMWNQQMVGLPKAPPPGFSATGGYV